MNRFIVFALLMLVVIAFLFGLNLGKQVQSIDTPVKKIYEKVVVTSVPTPTIKLTPAATSSATPRPSALPILEVTPQN